jgi:creatinine amidohydrolase
MRGRVQGRPGMTPPPPLAWGGRRGALLAAAGVAAAPAGRFPLPPPPPEEMELAGMTWPRLRALIEAGWRGVILPTGGIEQNGPHMALDKHDHIVRWAARRIAEALGRTLVAPVVSFVPQGSWDPPVGNMRFPGTIGITPAAFEALLEGIARSLKAAGFRTICLIGDHGESQAPQAAVARCLSAAWAGREGCGCCRWATTTGPAPRRRTPGCAPRGRRRRASAPMPASPTPPS